MTRSGRLLTQTAKIPDLLISSRKWAWACFRRRYLQASHIEPWILSSGATYATICTKRFQRKNCEITRPRGQRGGVPCQKHSYSYYIQIQWRSFDCALGASLALVPYRLFSHSPAAVCIPFLVHVTETSRAFLKPPYPQFKPSPFSPAVPIILLVSLPWLRRSPKKTHCRQTQLWW